MAVVEMPVSNGGRYRRSASWRRRWFSKRSKSQPKLLVEDSGKSEQCVPVLTIEVKLGIFEAYFKCEVKPGQFRFLLCRPCTTNWSLYGFWIELIEGIKNKLK